MQTQRTTNTSLQSGSSLPLAITMSPLKSITFLLVLASSALAQGHGDFCHCYLGTVESKGQGKELMSGNLLEGSDMKRSASFCEWSAVDACASNCTRFIRERTVVDIDDDANVFLDLDATLPNRDTSLKQLLCNSNPSLKESVKVQGWIKYQCYFWNTSDGIIRPADRFRATKLKSNVQMKC